MRSPSISCLACNCNWSSTSPKNNKLYKPDLVIFFVIKSREISVKFAPNCCLRKFVENLVAIGLFELLPWHSTEAELFVDFAFFVQVVFFPFSTLSHSCYGAESRNREHRQQGLPHMSHPFTNQDILSGSLFFAN